jgi:hypothetical protein
MDGTQWGREGAFQANTAAAAKTCFSKTKQKPPEISLLHCQILQRKENIFPEIKLLAPGFETLTSQRGRALLTLPLILFSAPASSCLCSLSLSLSLSLSNNSKHPRPSLLLTCLVLHFFLLLGYQKLGKK